MGWVFWARNRAGSLAIVIVICIVIIGILIIVIIIIKVANVGSPSTRSYRRIEGSVKLVLRRIRGRLVSFVWLLPHRRLISFLRRLVAFGRLLRSVCNFSESFF